MEWVETTGKTVPEAMERALDQLGVDESDAEFEVLGEPKTGLFGRLRAEARVRARVRPSAPRSKEASSRRRRPERARGPKSEVKTTPAGGDDNDDTEDSDEPSSSERSRSHPERAPRKRSNNRNRQRNQPQTEGASTMEDQVALTEQGEIARGFLSGFLDAASAPGDISVVVDEDDEIISIGVEGDSLGHLIGVRGATLQSLQELTRTVVQRKTGARNGRIIVDISSYRKKRREALERFTRQIAEDVISSGAALSLEPMNPADRKTVHDAANEIAGVETTSEGEEPRRRVVLKPSESA